MKKFVVMTTMALCSIFSPLTGVGQELNCAVEINTDKVQNANKEVFSTLQSAISDYMNTQRWTDA